jgi:hypothetical protein
MTRVQFEMRRHIQLVGDSDFPSYDPIRERPRRDKTVKNEVPNFDES